MDKSNFDPVTAQEQLLNASISKKDITRFLSDLHEKFTVEQFVTFCKFEEPGLTVRKYEKYLELYAEDMSLSEYLHYVDAQKALRKATGNSMLDSTAMTFILYYILTYVRKGSKVSIEDYAQYMMRNADPLYSFDFIGCPLSYEAYISYLEAGYPTTSNPDDKQKKVMRNFATEYAKQHIRDCSVIEDGCLKKCNATKLSFVCIPDEVLRVEKGAFKDIKRIQSIALHDKFESFFDEPNCVYYTSTLVKDENGDYPDWFDCRNNFQMPMSLKYVSPKLFENASGGVTVPDSLENLEQLKEYSFGKSFYITTITSEPQKQPKSVVDWTNKNFGAEYRKIAEQKPEIDLAVKIFSNSLKMFEEQRSINNWPSPILVIDTKYSPDTSCLDQFDLGYEFMNVIKNMEFVSAYGGEVKFCALFEEYWEKVKNNIIYADFREGGLICYDVIIAIAVAVFCFVDKKCTAEFQFYDSKWEYRGDYTNKKRLFYEISPKYPEGIAQMRKAK